MSVFVALTARTIAQPECVQVLQASHAGSYTLSSTATNTPTYLAGFGYQNLAEYRNWFVFELPVFPAPLTAAELRLLAGFASTNALTTFELHPVTTLPFDLINRNGDRTNTFSDLGDGPVLGGRIISGAESARAGTGSALIGVSFNAAGLAELEAGQGSTISLGGAVPRTATRVFAFGGSVLDMAPVQLVLYFSNVSPPQATIHSTSFPEDILAEERINLSGSVCGKEPLHRQWEKDGVPVPNATNDILEVRFARPSDSGTYRLRGSNDLGTATGGPIEVRVVPLRITEQPQSFTANVGDYRVLNVNVSSRLPLWFQWRKNGTNLPGYTAPVIQFQPTTSSDSGTYDVVITNIAGAVTSQIAHVRVTISPPSIRDVGPDSVRLAVGGYLSLSFYVDGNRPMTFQWYKDGQEVPGAGGVDTNAYANLFIGSVGFNDAGEYWLVAANVGGHATSKVVRVTVEALVIDNVYDASIPWRSTFTLSPSIVSFVPVGFQWYFNDAILTNGTSHYLSFPSFDAAQEGTYFLVGSNAYGVVTSAVARLTIVQQAPSVSVGVSPTKAWAGEDVLLYASVSGGPPPTLQWLFNGDPIPGATQDRLTLNSVRADQTGAYALWALNTRGSVTSAPVTLTVIAEAPFFLQLPDSSNVVAGSFITLRARAVGGPMPTYQWRKDGVELPGETNTALVLGSVSDGGSGTYEIIARNELGSATHCVALRVSLPTGLDKWVWRRPVAQGSRLRKIAFADGRYVAVGKSGNVITSTDSTNWASVVLETDVDLRALAGGNGAFVAAGELYEPLVQTNLHKFEGSEYNRFLLTDYPWLVLVSSNAMDWSMVNHPDASQVANIIYGNGVFISFSAVSGIYHTSPDGRVWTSHAESQMRIFQLLFGNGRFLAYGPGGNAFYSVNGVDWASVGRSFFLMGFGNGNFVGRWDSIYQSENGVDWVRAGPSSFTHPDFIAGGNGVYVGPGYPAGWMMISSNAWSWASRDTRTRQEIEHVIFADGQFLGVGEAGTVTRSVDGRFWTENEVANKIDYYGITHGQGLHVAAGDAGTILISSNGVDWTLRQAPTTRNLHAVAYGNGMFVAGGRNGTLLTSSNGMDWTLRPSPTTNYVERIAWANGLWVAVTEGGDLAISSTGESWIRHDTGLPRTDHEGVCFGNGLWVVVGGYFNPAAVGTVFTSTDGWNTTRRSANPGKRWRDVTYGKGMFVTVGNDGAMGYSTNGIDWRASNFIASMNLRRIHYANGRFVAVGNDGTLISSVDPANGRPWTRHRSRNSQNLHDIVAAPDGTFLFVGNNGMLLQSGNTRPRLTTLGRHGQLEFDRGIAETLRLERSTDLQTWQPESFNATSPHPVTIGGGNKFWRLVSE